MINAGDIQKVFGIKLYCNSEMNVNMLNWIDLYSDNFEYKNERIKNIGLPLAISSEFARLALTEFSCSLKNSAADRDFQLFANNLQNAVEIGCAVGGLVLKPYVSNGRIYTDIVKQSDFYPVRYNAYGITSAIIPEQITVENRVYTRLEYHDFNEYDGTHSIYNKCFCSSDISALGSECSLKSIPQWSELREKHIFYNVPSPLFSFFKTPFSNHIDFGSPLGISVFGNAIELIRQADEHWERILWEFESSERAIDATEDIFRMKDGKPQLPKGRERMFRTYDIMSSADSRPFIETFSPEIRDNSLFNGFNRILQRIEFNCGLAYGTISDISNVEKTAEEIKTSKQRSYANICMIQQNLKSALENLAVSYGYLLSCDCPLTCTFGDSVLEDTEKEFQRRLQMVSAGILSKEQFISWYFGCSPDEAVNYLPKTADLFGGE